MTRIVDQAAANQLMSFVQRTQQRVNTLQTQLSSGKTSQDYAGIARESGRLIRLENARDLYQRFITTNQTMDLRLKTVESTLDSIQKTIKDFRAAVIEYGKGATDNRERVAAVQDAAFKSLVGLQGLLNTEFDGRFLFGGSKVTSRPVDFGLSTLDALQNLLDGAMVTAPTTREAHLADVALTHAVTGDLAFDGASGTIRFGDPAALAAIPVGATVTFSGTAANDGIAFTVIGKTGANPGDPVDRLVVRQETLTPGHALNDESPAPATSTVRIDSYYHGDSVATNHRVDSERGFSLEFTAADPAFEKAIRAMKLIAQGKFGSEGGLDRNAARIDQALALLDSALDRASQGPGPFGPEAPGNIETLQSEVGLHRVLINDTNERLRKAIGMLDGHIAGVENINPTEVATRLFDQANALEASLTTIARVRQLSLVKFL